MIFNTIVIMIMIMIMSICESSSTGPPVSGDIIKCFDNDVQLVFSKGPCESLKIGLGKTAYGSFTYYHMSDINKIIKELKWKEVDCTSIYQIYYVISVKGTCTLSTNTSNKKISEEIIQAESNIDYGFVEENNINKNKYDCSVLFLMVVLCGLGYLFLIKND